MDAIFKMKALWQRGREITFFIWIEKVHFCLFDILSNTNASILDCIIVTIFLAVFPQVQGVLYKDVAFCKDSNGTLCMESQEKMVKIEKRANYAAFIHPSSHFETYYIFSHFCWQREFSFLTLLWHKIVLKMTPKHQLPI